MFGHQFSVAVVVLILVAKFACGNSIHSIPISAVQTKCLHHQTNFPKATDLHIFCGINSTIQVLIDFKKVENANISSHSLTLREKTCFINRVDVYQERHHYDQSNYILQLNYSIQQNDKSTPIEGKLPLNCTIFVEDKAQFIVKGYSKEWVAIYPTLPRIQYILALDVKNYGVVGAKQSFTMQVVAKPSNRRLNGQCLINSRSHTIFQKVRDDKTINVVTYTVRVNDAPRQFLTVNCTISDNAGNRVFFSDVIKNSPEVDGTIPNFTDYYNVNSTDKPAKIGSEISFKLLAINAQTGLSGSCSINGNNLQFYPLIEEGHGYYLVKYEVMQGEISINKRLFTLKCKIYNRAKNELLFQRTLQAGFFVDSVPPQIKDTAIIFSSSNPAEEGSVIEAQITARPGEERLSISNHFCFINNASVSNSFVYIGKNNYILTYVVGKEAKSWEPGLLPILCKIEDRAKNVYTIRKFTVKNDLRARQIKLVNFRPKEISAYLPGNLLAIGFFIVAVASHTISKVFPKFGLPKISGYFLTGILAGPYVLVLISRDEMTRLRFIDEISLAYIGMVAGSKLHWSEMRPLLRSITYVTIGLTIFEYVVGTATIIVLANYLDFLKSTTNAEKYAIAMLAGCMMIARSPSSALAIIQECKARGHFTTLIFAVTVVCDIVVIIIFNINSVVAELILSSDSKSIAPSGIGSNNNSISVEGNLVSGGNLLVLIAQLCLSIICGIISGKLMGILLLWRTSVKRKSYLYLMLQFFKQAVFLMYGFAIFVASHWMHPWIEPLLCCMVAGASMWNCSAHPEELEIIIHKLADVVYVSFFTLTGAGLQLDMLVKAVVVSSVLCFTRICAIFFGSFLGGILAKEKMEYNKVSWMAYITQAGVTLGLAKQIQLLYPGWGTYFSTFIVAVVICNQIVGPLFLRYVLHYVGDVISYNKGQVEGKRSIIITDGNKKSHSESAQQRMIQCGWKCAVTVTSPDSLIPHSLTLNEDLKEAIKFYEPLDVVVVMMSEDEMNFRIIQEIANVCNETKRISVLRIVVNVVDNSPDAGWAWKYAEMPVDEHNGDAIDVIVVEQNVATYMLIELAAEGKVIGGAEISSPKPKSGRAFFPQGSTTNTNSVENNIKNDMV